MLKSLLMATLAIISFSKIAQAQLPPPLPGNSMTCPTSMQTLTQIGYNTILCRDFDLEPNQYDKIWLFQENYIGYREFELLAVVLDIDSAYRDFDPVYSTVSIIQTRVSDDRHYGPTVLAAFVLRNGVYDYQIFGNRSTVNRYSTLVSITLSGVAQYSRGTSEPSFTPFSSTRNYSNSSTNSVCPDGGSISGFNGWTSDYENVNVRTGPRTASGIVIQLPKESLVQIHSWQQENDGRWAWLTTSDGETGWAREPYISCISPHATGGR